MLRSLELRWSDAPSASEKAYRAAGLQRTAGTIFLLPPSQAELTRTFNERHKGRSLSVGARALCKHYERRQSTEEVHPFWSLPTGSEANKTEMANNVLNSIMREACWRNVLLLHPGVAVYEIRISAGYGMRWTLELDPDMNMHDIEMQRDDTDSSQTTTFIRRVSFRGFLEPPAACEAQSRDSLSVGTAAE